VSTGYLRGPGSANFDVGIFFRSAALTAAPSAALADHGRASYTDGTGCASDRP
jgi:hypothetical protein